MKAVQVQVLREFLVLLREGLGGEDPRVNVSLPMVDLGAARDTEPNWDAIAAPRRSQPEWVHQGARLQPGCNEHTLGQVAVDAVQP